MTKITMIEAVKKSIEKWEGIVAGTERDRGRGNCALCEEHWSFNKQRCCEGCPVQVKTGEQFCHGTPYEDWDTWWRRLQIDRPVMMYKSLKTHRLSKEQRKTAKKLAEAELKFLLDLLKEVQARDMSRAEK